MYFLNPFFLFATLFALLPLLIHLFNRQKVKKIEFSSVAFLKAMERTKIRRLKLRQLWLLLLRTLIILLVALAFARPAVRGKFGRKVGSHAKTSAVIILDNSASMGLETKNGSLFELAQKKTQKIIDLFAEGDETALVLTNGGGQPTLTHNFRRLSRDLAEAQLSSGATALDRTIASAARLLSSSKNLNREIFLFSDLKSPAGAISDTALSHFHGKLFLFPVKAADYENVSLQEIDFGRQLITLGVPFQMTAKVQNQSPRPEEGLLVGLWLDGQKVSQTDLSVPAQKEATVKFTLTVTRPGWHSGWVELPDDDLLADNRRFFAFYLPPQIRVVIVSEAGQPAEHLRLALTAGDSSQSRFAVATIPPEKLLTYDLSPVNVLVFNELKKVPAGFGARLDSFQKHGGLFVILGTGFDLPSYQSAIFLRFGSVAVESGRDTIPGSGFYTLEQIDFSHPIFQVYQKIPHEKFPQLRFFSVPKVTAGDLTRLASFSNGQPALVEKKAASQPALLFAGPLNPTESDLPRHPFFVPFVQRTVEYLAFSPFAQAEQILVGDTLQRPVDFVYYGKKLVVEDPAKQKLEASAFLTGEQAWVRIEPTDLPGIYQVKAGDDLAAAFAVNLDPRESNQPAWEPASLKRQAPGLGVFTGDPSDPARAILSSRIGKELWKPLLWAAALLLMLEMLVARSAAPREATEFPSS